MAIVLEVTNLKKYFFPDRQTTVKAVDDVSFTIHEGETVGLVGESGCGKSTLARTVLGLYEPQAGSVAFRGWNVTDKAAYHAHRHEIQKGIQMVFQDPDGALNPHMTAAECLAEPLRLFCGEWSKKKLDTRIDELFCQVGLDQVYRNYYPGELSGGQRQRVAIARCIAARPALFIADEPIAALDVSVQAQIINLLQDLQDEQHFSMLYIAHDLAMVRHICDSVLVMYKGKLVEAGDTEEVFAHPMHGYTRQLLSSILIPDPERERSKEVVIFDESTFHETAQMVHVSPGHRVLE